MKKSTAGKMNLSVASNIMKQINSKVGGESLRVDMPASIKSSLPMIIGIDVCHSGKYSVVGFCASIDKSFNRYYSNFLAQRKYQEIIKKDLDYCLDQALKAFQQANKNQLPSKIIIYRDGVGEQMREQIIENEITQVREILKSKYNSATGPPPITLIVVNKRINQRMFAKASDGQTMINPPPGSIIDSKLVENQSTKCFDFFLVPQ